MILMSSSAYAQLGEPVKIAEGVSRPGYSQTSGVYDISNGAEHVVFFSDNGNYSDYKADLVSVPIAGGTISKLNIDLDLSQEITEFKISPDGKRVLYLLSDVNDVDIFYLYSVPIQGGTSTKLTERLTTQIGDATSPSFLFTPDSQNVVYKEITITPSPDFERVDHLSITAIDGGSSSQLSSGLVSGEDVESFLLSPDGMNVVYRAGSFSEDAYKLFSVPITGGTSVQLSQFLNQTGSVFEYKISPDSTTVIYQAEATNLDVKDILKVSILGGDSTKLNVDIGINVNVSFFEFSPDSEYVIYATTFLNTSYWNLYSVNLTSVTPIHLNPTSLGIGPLFGTFITDGQRVVFTTGVSGDDRATGLYSVSVTGGPVVRLNSAVAQSVSGASIVSLSDNHTVMYSESIDDGTSALYSTPIAGGIRTALNQDTKFNRVRASNDNGEVLFWSIEENITKRGLFYVAGVGSEVVRVNANPGQEQVILSGLFSPSSEYFVYQLSDYSNSGVPFSTELYSVKKQVDDETCFPIRTANEGIAVICL